MKPKSIILLSTADWDNPFWTNKQHVAMELNRLGHRILYIDSLGLRRPSSTVRDFKRIGRRILRGFLPPRLTQEGLWVWSPIVLPQHDKSWVQKFNRFWLSTSLEFWLKWLGLKPDWLWTYNPLTTRLLDLAPYSCRIYHCVDEIKAQPGMPAQLLEVAEEELSKRVDLVFTTSHRLTHSRRAWNPNTFYHSNVVDFSHFHSACSNETVVPADLARISSPRIGFIGALSGYKVDFPLLRHIAQSRPNWSIVLIGEVGEGDPWTDASLLDGLPNLHLMGPRSYQELPSYLKGLDVALLPNLLNDYTQAMFPMKFFEYLAAGVPVVGVQLQALQDFSHVAKLVDTPDAFLEAIEQTLLKQVPPIEQRMLIAQEHTYAKRTQRMLAQIAAVLQGRSHGYDSDSTISNEIAPEVSPSQRL